MLLMLCLALFRLQYIRTPADPPLSDVILTEGVLVYDSTYSQNSNLVLRIFLKECENSFANRAQAHGLVTVISKEKALLAAGTSIRAKGEFSEGLFIADEITVTDRTKLAALRESYLLFLESRLLSPEPKAWEILSSTLLLGRSEDQKTGITELSRQSGTLHILALSGMHIGLVSKAAGLLLKKGKLRKALQITAVSLYMILVYPRPSVIRAYLMMILSFLTPRWNILISFLLHLTVFPYHSTDTGFIYGYLALSGLIFLSKDIRKTLEVFLPRFPSSFLSQGLSVMLLCCPYQILSDNTWYPLCFIAGPLCSLPIALTMVLGLLKLILPYSRAVGKAMEITYTVLERILRFFSCSQDGKYLYLLYLITFLVYLLAFLAKRIAVIVNKPVHCYNQGDMWEFDYTNVGAINSLLNENGLGMTKKFGQNFLISDNALSRIADLSGVQKGMRVWEIGPGIGALTTKLVSRGASVTAFEIDHGFCRILREKVFCEEDDFTLIEGDALKTWKQVYDTDGEPDLICANLPYNVGSVLIASFIENRMIVPRMVYTLQTEVVKRMCAGRDSDQYSGFSVVTQLDYENKEAMKLRSSNFWPAPNVDSSVVVMERRKTPLIDEQYAQHFLETVRVIFAQRRKTVRNNLKAVASSDRIEKALANAGISDTERAERLTTEQILEISKAIF